MKERLFNWLGENIWVFLTGSIFLGILFPKLKIFKPYIAYFLMVVLYVTFLKVDVNVALSHIKRPLLIIYYVLMNLVISPIILYFLFFAFTKNYSILSSVLLLGLVPSGVAASAMTDVSKGETPLTVVLTIVSHLVAIFTIPTIFFIVFRKSMNLNYISILIDVAKLIGIPLILATLSNMIFKEKINFIKKRAKLFTVISLVFVISSIMAVNSTYIKETPTKVLIYLSILYVVFIFSQLFSFFTVPSLSVKEKIAISNAKTFSNIGLGLVIASKYLSPEAAIILALSQIPWPTMLISLKIILKLSSKISSSPL